MITLEHIQLKLAEAIGHCGLTQTEIANRLGIRPTQICSYVKGRKLPALDTLANLCKVIGVPPNEILCYDE